jgi:hypothetical protein
MGNATEKDGKINDNINYFRPSFEHFRNTDRMNKLRLLLVVFGLATKTIQIRTKEC